MQNKSQLYMGPIIEEQQVHKLQSVFWNTRTLSPFASRREKSIDRITAKIAVVRTHK